MSDQDDQPTADGPTEAVPTTEVAPEAPDVPSSTPVEGWVRGADGQWWPPAPVRQRPGPTAASTPPKSRRGRRLVGGLGFAIFVIAVLAIVAGIVAVLVNYGDDSDSSANTTKGAHAIGDVARSASVDFTVRNAQNPYTESESTPQPGPGFHFVAIPVTMTNVSTKDLVVAPPQQFELTDASGQKERQIAGTSAPTLEGALVALGTRQGFVVFDVPDSAVAPFTFRAKGEPAAGGVTYLIP